MNLRIILTAFLLTPAAGCVLGETDIGGFETETGSGSASDSGNDSVSADGASDSGPAPAVCVPVTTMASYTDECLAEFCLDSRQVLITDVDPDARLECSGPGGSEDCAAEGEFLQRFGYISDDINLTLSFENAINGNYSTESFNELLYSIAGQLYVGEEQARVTTFIGGSEVTGMVYADGRLQLSFSVDFQSPFYTIESDADDCISDDIAGICPCFYEPLGSVEVTIDLPIEAG